MSGCTVLPGDAGDLAEVMVSMEDAFDPAFGEAWTRGQCLSIISLAGVTLRLARVDGEPAGFALVRDMVDEAELLLLAVRAPFRRRGIARALIAHTIDAASERRIARIHLEVRAGNSAIELYRAMGFSQIGHRSGYYRGCDGALYDALTMSLSVMPNGVRV